MSCHLSAHRENLLRTLIADYLSYSFQQTITLESAKVPLILSVIKSHQLLLPQDSPSAFTTPVIPPTLEQKKAFHTLRSHKQAIDKFVSCVERLITSKDIQTRCGGLELLKETIRMCPYASIQVRQSHWIVLLMEILKKYSVSRSTWVSTSVQEIKYSLQCLQAFISRIQQLQSIKSSVHQGPFTTLPSVLINFLSKNERNTNNRRSDLDHEVILTISSILQFMPTLLKSHYLRIQNVLIPFLGDSEEAIRSASCQVISLLPQCARQNETQLVFGMAARVLAALNDLMNLLFVKVDLLIDNEWLSAYQQPTADDLAFDLSFLKTTSFTSSAAIQERFQVIFMFATSFLSILENIFTLSYSGVVEYPTGDLIDMVRRSLAIDPEWLFQQKKNSSLDQTHILQLLSFLPMIHIGSIKVLVAALEKVQAHLLPACETIAAIFVKSSTFYHVHNTPFSGDFRAETYRLGSSCIRLFGVNVLNSLVVPLIHSVTNQYDDLYTVVSRKTQIASLSLNKSKKKRKRSEMARHSSGKHFNHFSVLEDQIPLSDCFSSLHFQEALNALEIAVLKCGPFLSVELRSQIDQFVLAILLSYSNIGVISVYSPLHDPKTRLSAFNLLLASVLRPQLHLPSALPYAVRFFSLGQTDPSPEVSLFCLRASAHCDSILHPIRTPSIPLVADISADALFEYNITKPVIEEITPIFTVIKEIQSDPMQVDIPDQSQIEQRSEVSVPQTSSMSMQTTNDFSFTNQSTNQKSSSDQIMTPVVEKQQQTNNLFEKSIFAKDEHKEETMPAFVPCSPDASDVSSDEDNE